MPQAEQPKDQLSEYERAVCYYTLPRVISPVTVGAMAVYAAFIVLAIAAMVYGFYAEQRVWWLAGMFFFSWMVALGSITFLFRAFLNEMTERRALTEARGLVDAAEEDFDIPDPFAGHVLLKHPVAMHGRLFSCTEDDATLMYFVDSPKERLIGFRRRGESWNIRTAHDTEYCHIEVFGLLPSFVVDPALPGKLFITREGKEVARIVSRFSFQAPTAEIQLLGPEPKKYLVRRQGIYFEGRLIGRLYGVRQSDYLDIRKEHFNEGILAYFAVWS